ncbi:MAG: hypothetical protein CBC13_11300 [Planctomycetia bacterium TMED53]|nr:MAG: hypothetical protein CBC13_11300 [Planctomycetia bacterium TMED53]
MSIENIDGVGGIGAPEGADGPDKPGQGPDKAEGAESTNESGKTGEIGGSEGVSEAQENTQVDPGDKTALRPGDQIDTPPSHLDLLEKIHQLPADGSPLEKKSEEQIQEMSEGFKAADEEPLKEIIQKILNEGI